jgi:hypothetical protein
MVAWLGPARAAVVVAAALCSCAHPAPKQPVVRAPLGISQPLQQGHWRGMVGPTLVDFHIDRISPGDVSIHIYGAMPNQVNRSMETQHVPTSFVDHPRTCKIKDDDRSFDCNRYTDMHIDNGFLCGIYQAPSEVFQPCLEPVE